MADSKQGRIQIIFTPDRSDPESADVSWEFFPGSSEPRSRCTSRFTIPEAFPSVHDQNLIAFKQREFGEMLFRALFDGQADAISILNRARTHALETKTPLFFDLYFCLDAVQFAKIPWEFLRDPVLSVDLLLGPRSMVGNCVRNLDLPLPPGPAEHIQLPLRILIVQPSSTAQNSQRFVEDLKGLPELQRLEAIGLLQIEDVQPPVTLIKVSERVARKPHIHMLHFMGEGHIADQGGVIILDATEKRPVSVAFDRFQSIFGGIHTAALFANHTSQSGQLLLNGIATALSAAGVPYVFGMQSEIPPQQALRGSLMLYEALARGATHQQALGRMRKALYEEHPSGSSWYVPTLFTRRTPGQPEAPLINLRTVNPQIDLEQAYLHLCKAEQQLASIGAGALLAVVREQKRQLEGIME